MTAVPRFIPLSRLYAANRDPRAPVAVSSDRIWRWNELASNAAALADELARYPQQRWALFSESSYRFALGFVALLQAQKTIVLPAGRPSSARLKEEGRVEALLADSAENNPGIPSLSLSAETHACWLPHASRAICADRPEQTRVELCTSGSTGEAKVVVKRLSNLEREIAVLESIWGAALENTLSIATVSHQHIYGLLFHVLWPLCAGRPFFDRTVFYPESVAALLGRWDACCLVSSPAHLKRLPPSLDATVYGRQIRTCFSSGGLLSTEAAKRLRARTGLIPIEVLGSTETGGVAWRSQRGDAETAWRPLPEVELDVPSGGGALQVRSPFLSTDGWFEMGDLVEPAEGGFLLKGRGDRIFKVEERRFAPAQMETRLASHPYVDECAVTVLELRYDDDDASSSDARTRSAVAAAVVLSAEGRARLQGPTLKEGRPALRRELCRHLADWFEPILIPKRMRFLAELPRNAQGKVTKDLLDAVFESSPTAPSGLPAIASLETRDDHHASYTVSVPPELAHFEGHFQGAPILPAYVQMEWIVQLIKEAFAVCGSLEIEVAKFHRPLLPGDRARLALDWEQGTGRVRYKMSSDERVVSSGTIAFAHAASAREAFDDFDAGGVS